MENENTEEGFFYLLSVKRYFFFFFIIKHLINAFRASGLKTPLGISYQLYICDFTPKHKRF